MNSALDASMADVRYDNRAAVPFSRSMRRLRERMRESAVSQNAIAAHLRVSETQISRYFTSNDARRVAPRVTTFDLMEAALEAIVLERSAT